MTSGEIERMRVAMESAAAALDFEEAKRLRDRINLLRGGADIADVREADTSGIARQRPGSMGIGTSRQRVVPPDGWTRPPKPDPMTGRPRRK